MAFGTIRRRCLAAVGVAVLCISNVLPGASGEERVGKSETAHRRGFLGAFFRSQGTPPFGVFAKNANERIPQPYPMPRSALFGAHGYCDEPAANGVSIAGAKPVDAVKLRNIVDLGVGWTRTTPSSFFDDHTHVKRFGSYDFTDFDAAQCALIRHDIVPLVALEAGPVQYDTAGQAFAPQEQPRYKTPAEFGTWCGTVAAHERRAFPMVYRYALPGNEVNSATAMFRNEIAVVADYSAACYKAVKAADPRAFVYGLDLNMDGNLDAPGFVKSLYDRGCGPGSCYDGISMHLTLRYPIPPEGKACFPHTNGDYSLQCINDVREAARAHVHILIGETVYTIPGMVPNEASKAAAVVAAYRAFAADPYVDGMLYANVDECALYPTGYFRDGCLIDESGKKLPAYDALQRIAATDLPSRK